VCLKGTESSAVKLGIECIFVSPPSLCFSFFLFCHFQTDSHGTDMKHY